VFAGGALLAWRFKRNNLMLAVLALALPGPALRLAPSGTVHDAIALLLPANLAGLAWIPDRGLLTASGRLRLVLIAVQAGFIALLAHPNLAPVTGVLSAPLVDALPHRVGALAQPALVATAAAVIAATVWFARERRPEDAATVWAIAGVALALASTDGGFGLALWLSAAGLALIVGLVEASYRMAYGDELTGLPARRALDAALRQLGPRYTIAMVDVDHFKKFNDAHGHPAGDQLLRMVATRLRSVGGGGRAFRYGGEEFAIVFPDTAIADVLAHLEDVRRAIESSAFVLRGADRPQKRPGRSRPERSRADRGRSSARGRRSGSGSVGVTVSIGVAGSRGRRPPEPRAVLEAADAALYRAKNGGRNRVST
jgi:GGDEF domain-containing protein